MIDVRKLGPLTALFGLALLSSGCSSYCGRAQPYQRVQAIPVLVGTGDLQVPRAPNALLIPADKNDPHALTFGYKVPDPAQPGHDKLVCLDQPPPMPPQGTTK